MSKYTNITLDKDRNLRYSYKAFDLIEQMFGCALHKIDFENMKVSDTAKLLFAGLIHEDVSITLDKIKDILDDIGFEKIPYIAETIGKAMTEAMGNQQAPGQVKKK